MSTYEAQITRDGKWWMIAVPSIGALTQARRLSEAEQMAKELVAVTLDVEVQSVQVGLSFDAVGQVSDIAATLHAIKEERRAALELEQKASREAASLAKRLVAEKIPIRDVGAILGVSHQRAHQLLVS